MLLLGREIEVALDVITESAPEKLPLTTEYTWQAHWGRWERAETTESL